MGLALLALVSWVFGIMTAVAGDLPALENRAQFERAENSIIVDRNGTRLATLTNNEGRVLVESDEIAPVMKEAVVAIEDRRFYEHRGVDYQGIARALYQDVLAGSAEQGASTITQQFVKNALAAQEDRTVFQKLREAALAYQLERHWTKDKIITEYLNSIYFGEGAYGIEAAAKTFFGSAHPGCGEEGQPTCASELLPCEAATLAGIIASPTSTPTRPRRVRAPGRSQSRRTGETSSSSNMREQGYITEEEYADYSSGRLPPPSQIEPPADDSIAPYFTSWLRQQLVDKYGAGEAFGGGLVVKSTLDLELQQQVEALVSSRVDGVGLDSSVVVLDNETAGVLAMVGGDDYAKEPFNLATNGLRQAGSSFKPFTLVTGLEEGHSTDEIFNSTQIDIPFEVKSPKKDGSTEVLPDLFEVNNYADTYRGPITLFDRHDLLRQLRLLAARHRRRPRGHRGHRRGPRHPHRPAAYDPKGGPRVLAQGLRASIRYPPSMILGSQVVTPLEMAHAYNSIEEDGDRVSGTMASSKGGPVAIAGRLRRRPDNGRRAGRGQGRQQRRQRVDPRAGHLARDRRDRRLHPYERRHLRYRQARPDGRAHLGQDRHHRRQRRRLVLRRHPGHHRLRLGRPRRFARADAHRVRRRARRRRHHPRADLRRRRERLPLRLRGGGPETAPVTEAPVVPEPRPGRACRRPSKKSRPRTVVPEEEVARGGDDGGAARRRRHDAARSSPSAAPLSATAGLGLRRDRPREVAAPHARRSATRAPSPA